MPLPVILVGLQVWILAPVPRVKVKSSPASWSLPTIPPRVTNKIADFPLSSNVGLAPVYVSVVGHLVITIEILPLWST